MCLYNSRECSTPGCRRTVTTLTGRCALRNAHSALRNHIPIGPECLSGVIPVDEEEGSLCSFCSVRKSLREMFNPPPSPPTEEQLMISRITGQDLAPSRVEQSLHELFWWAALRGSLETLAKAVT